MHAHASDTRCTVYKYTRVVFSLIAASVLIKGTLKLKVPSGWRMYLVQS